LFSDGTLSQMIQELY